MTKLEKLRLALLAILSIAATVGFILSYQFETSASAATFTNQPLPTNTVYIAGAVASPGVYEIKAKSTVADAITLAGGLASGADSEYLNTKLNLASVAEAGQKIEVPFLVKTTTGVEPAKSTTSGQKISLNSATKDQLMDLPGVGEVLAGNIIAARPYKQISDLNNAKGIGDTKFKQLELLVEL